MLVYFFFLFATRFPYYFSSTPKAIFYLLNNGLATFPFNYEFPFGRRIFRIPRMLRPECKVLSSTVWNFHPTIFVNTMSFPAIPHFSTDVNHHASRFFMSILKVCCVAGAITGIFMTIAGVIEKGKKKKW